jgi:hypothetical protein
LFRRYLPSPSMSVMLFAFPSPAPHTQYWREQASGTSTTAEDPARDRRPRRFSGSVLTRLLAPEQLLCLLPGDRPCVNDYIQKAIYDLHCVHLPAPTSYEYINQVIWDDKQRECLRLLSVFKPLDLHVRYPQQGRRWGSP